MQSLRGKKALITGAAHGIGYAIAEKLAEEGAQVVLADINDEALAEAGGRIEEKGGKCLACHLDVTDDEEISDTREWLKDEIGGIDVLVNNAGIVKGGAFLDVPMEEHRLTFRVNVDALVAMTHAFLGDLIDAREGHLVNIASASGLVGLPWGSTYAASKWAVIGFSESIRLELKRLGHHHVGVTAVCPGYVSTGMFDGVKPPLLTPFLTPETGTLPTAVTDKLMDVLGASTGMKSWKGGAG
jgi:short-subunit dehydrogenase